MEAFHARARGHPLKWINGQGRQIFFHPGKAIQTAEYPEYAEEQGLENSGSMASRDLIRWK